MSLPIPIPAPAVQHPQATIVWPRNPFHPADKDIYPVQPGSTVADWMQAQSITEFPLPTVCLVNGRPLLRRDWGIRPLATHDVVVLVGLPGGGGGGGGSNPLRVVLSIAVMVLAPYAAAGLTGYGMTAAGIAAAQAAMGTIGFGLLAAGVSVLGAYLVNALVPLPSANVPSAQNALAPSPTYSLQSQGNFARLLQPIPVIYGRHLVYPDLGATPYTEYVNNEQYLHQLLVIGQGDYEIEAVRIEDTPIQSFEEVQAQVILPGGQNTLFNHDVVTAPEVAGQELLAIDDPANTRGEAIGPFIVNPPETRIDTLGIDILLPRGLFYANDAGDRSKAYVMERSPGVFLLSVHVKDLSTVQLEFQGDDLKRRVGNPNIHSVLEYSTRTGVTRSLVKGGAKYHQMLLKAFAEHLLHTTLDAQRLKAPTLDLSALRLGFDVPQAQTDGFNVLQVKSISLLSPDNQLKLDCTAMAASDHRCVTDLLAEKLPGPLSENWMVTAAQINLYYPPEPGRSKAKMVAIEITRKGRLNLHKFDAPLQAQLEGYLVALGILAKGQTLNAQEVTIGDVPNLQPAYED